MVLLLRFKNFFKLGDGRSSVLARNSFWGVVANITQNILFSVFFIVIARVYSVYDFANYILANSIYGIIASFSALGLGQWFLREMLNSDNKHEVVSRYFKIQLYLGLIFYCIHLFICFFLYEDGLLRSLSILIGINILFDNIISVIKQINIAEENQQKTFVVLTTEAILKAGTAAIIFFIPIPILYLAFVLIVLRFVTLNLFIHYASSGAFNLKTILCSSFSLSYAAKLLSQNWSFILIGSISVLYWRIGIVFVSKFLSGQDVVNYEVSYKLFSMAEILPFIVSSSIFPLLLNTYKQDKIAAYTLFKKFFLLYALYGLFSYTFIFSFSDSIIPLLFGSKFIGTALYCKEMFLTILVFPTALLQANMLIVMGLEKIDMLFNLISLLLHIAFCFLVLQFVPSLSVINYSILISFLAFHLLQDFFLYRKGILTLTNIVGFYVLIFLFVFFFDFLIGFFPGLFVFPIFWTPLLLLGFYFFSKFSMLNTPQSTSIL